MKKELVDKIKSIILLYNITTKYAENMLNALNEVNINHEYSMANDKTVVRTHIVNSIPNTITWSLEYLVGEYICTHGKHKTMEDLIKSWQ